MYLFQVGQIHEIMCTYGSSCMYVHNSGLMINFISGFVWSLMKKWMKGGEDGVWKGLDKQTIADVVLCYGIFIYMCVYMVMYICILLYICICVFT